MSSNERKVAESAPGLTPAALTLSRLLTDRFSCRGYLPDPVPRQTIETMLALAQNAASWCNSQPWQVHVTSGAATERLRAALMAEATKSASNPGGARPPEPDFPFPAAYTGVYKDRQREVGWQLYQSVGVSHGDRTGSAKQSSENFRLFGAPHSMILTTEKSLGHYGVLDCGIYVGTLLLAAQSMGIGIVPQAALANHSPMLRQHFDLPDHRAIVCGFSFGWPDQDHPANHFRSRRAGIGDAVAWAVE